ncbi:MAG: transcriptional repressor [Phycisphaeraceae bacterium]|nr:MAG: transcriptional repressor [Phycisphaeraceae bacterium]
MPDANGNPPPIPTTLSIVEPLCSVFRRQLKAEGLKYTPERARILDAIIELDGPFEADALLDQLNAEGTDAPADKRVSKATVYRTIKLLEDAAIIQRILFDRDQSRFQLVYGQSANTLLVRSDTGEVEAIEAPELIALRDRLCRERGLTPEGHRFQIVARGS